MQAARGKNNKYMCAPLNYNYTLCNICEEGFSISTLLFRFFLQKFHPRTYPPQMTLFRRQKYHELCFARIFVLRFFSYFFHLLQFLRFFKEFFLLELKKFLIIELLLNQNQSIESTESYLYFSLLTIKNFLKYCCFTTSTMYNNSARVVSKIV